ncbi:MAG: ABC transporter permease [Methylobacteriaceae bacterium]|nr:ABC transporter permease [Methylobacteriaceae bacterium]
MSLLEAFRSALEALRAHKLRSALTMLGVVIGVAAVIAMIAVGGGAREQVAAQIRTLGSNLIMLTPGNVTAGGVRLGAGQASSLTNDDAAAILADVPAVQATAPIIRSNQQVVAGASNWATQIVGVDLGWFEAREWDVSQGRLFTPEEVSRGALVTILGETVAKNLFGEDSPVGRQVRIKNVPFEVVGLAARKGQSALGQDQDDTAFAPLPTVRQRIAGSNRANARSVGTIMVKVREGEDMASAIEDVRALLRQRHRLQPDQEDDFGIRNLAEMAAVREASANTLASLLAAVAALSLAVGGIGIMNIMLVSVTERTREIGLRLAIGARPRDVMRQFLIEAATLSAIGGAIGVALGIGAAQVVAMRSGWPLLVEPQGVIMAVVFSAFVGVFFGWYPARRAAGLDPVEALRAT